MTYRVVIEPSAEREIRATVRWKAMNASPASAARWYNGLRRQIDTLRSHPLRCPVTEVSDRFPFEVRELLFGRRRRDTFRIFFTIRDDVVSILFVHHAAQQEPGP